MKDVPDLKVSWEDLINLYKTSNNDYKYQIKQVLKDLSQENNEFKKYLKNKGIVV